MREGDRHAHDRMVGKDHGLRNQVRAGSKQMQLSTPKYRRWRTPGKDLMTLGRKAGNIKPSAHRLFADGKRLLNFGSGRRDYKSAIELLKQAAFWVT